MNKYKGILKKEDIKFVAYFAGIFLGTFFILFLLGLLPTEISETDNGTIDALRLNAIEMASGVNNESTKTAPAISVAPAITKEKIIGEEPIRLMVPDANIDILVMNPKTKNNTLLDEYLTRGVIRYPDSALPGEGNVLIFGHSSNWAVVHNKAYKALNGVDKLKQGALIYVDSKASRYTYSVVKVNLVDADKEFIDFSTNKNMLTLSTCNTFGQKQERYVAEAEFVSKEAK